MKIVLVSESCNPQETEVFRWIADRCDPRIQWTILSTNQFPRLSKFRKPFVARHLVALLAAVIARLDGVDLVVTHGPEVAEWSGFFLRLMRARARHLAWGFTSTTFEELSRWRHALMRFSLRNVDRFITFSHRERRVYSKLLQLPSERFAMVPFSIGRPRFDEDSPPLIEGQYIAAMGGEGRDYRTLIDAVRGLPDVHLVIIARPDNLKGVDIPANVTVKFDLPYRQTLNIAAHAKAMVIPLVSREVPSGHLTLISQFHLGIPTLVTRAEVMEGYVVDGENALTCEAGDALGMRRQIERLLGEPDLREQLKRNGLSFALTQCAEARTIEYFHAYLQEHGLLADTDDYTKDYALQR